jgi:hypothetical protein
MPMWDDPPPDVESADPHDDGFSTGPFEAGPTAENITGGGDFPVAAEFDQSGGEFDVTPGAFDVDAAYDRGGNGVDEGPIADNIHVD